MTKKNSEHIKLSALEEELDKLATKYGSTGEVFYKDYSKGINEGVDPIVHIGHINTVFDNATDKEKSTVVELIAEIHKIRTQKTETERVTEGVGDTIALGYDGKDFGTLQLDTVYKGVSVTITYEGEILILKSKKKFDFYLQDRTRDTLFKHVKDELEVTDYNTFLNQLIPQIEAVLNEQRDRKTEPREEEEVAAEVYSDNVEERAAALVEDPGLFYRLGKDLEKGFLLPGVNRIRYILGEESLKRQLAIHMLAARYDRDTINIVYGGFATVKDTMLKMLLYLTNTPFLRRGHLTAAAMRYSKNIPTANVLYMPEADMGGEKGKQLRFLRSDDAGFEYEYAYSNPESGKMDTEMGHVDAKTLFITTNDVTFDPALVSGAWVFNTDDSVGLTKRVIKKKLTGFKEPLKTLTEEEMQVWHRACDILATKGTIPETIIIPFAENLEPLFNPNQSQARRNPEKLCELIQDIAILRRFQKPLNMRGEADLVDLFCALRIGGTAISETISELTPREIAIYEAVKSLESYEEDGVTTKNIAEKVTYVSNTCYRIAESLTEKGYFSQGKSGRSNIYSIKTKIENMDNLCLSLSQSVYKPIDLLKDCVLMVHPFLNFANFADPQESDIYEIKETDENGEKSAIDTPVIMTIHDPLDLYTYSVTILAKLAKIKYVESDRDGTPITKTIEFGVCSKDKQSLEEEDTPTEEGEPKKENETGEKTQKDVGTSEDTLEENSGNVSQTTTIEEGDAEVRGRISKGEDVEYQKMGGGQQ